MHPTTTHPFKQQTANTASHGGDHSYPNALVDDGVQAAIDARELIFSLRSEVSALERHSAALQTNLDRLEDASASTVNGAATAAAWTAYTVATFREKGRDKTPASNHDPGAKLAVEGAAVATKPAVAGGGSGKRAKAERRKHAADVLRQALGDGGGGESATPGGTVEGKEARAVGLAREARQRAEAAFVSRGVAEA